MSVLLRTFAFFHSEDLHYVQRRPHQKSSIRQIKLTTSHGRTDRRVISLEFFLAGVISLQMCELE